MALPVSSFPAKVKRPSSPCVLEKPFQDAKSGVRALFQRHHSDPSGRSSRDELCSSYYFDNVQPPPTTRSSASSPASEPIPSTLARPYPARASIETSTPSSIPLTSSIDPRSRRNFVSATDPHPHTSVDLNNHARSESSGVANEEIRQPGLPPPPRPIDLGKDTDLFRVPPGPLSAPMDALPSGTTKLLHENPPSSFVRRKRPLPSVPSSPSPTSPPPGGNHSDSRPRSLSESPRRPPSPSTSIGDKPGPPVPVKPRRLPNVPPNNKQAETSIQSTVVKPGPRSSSLNRLPPSMLAEHETSANHIFDSSPPPAGILSPKPMSSSVVRKKPPLWPSDIPETSTREENNSPITFLAGDDVWSSDDNDTDNNHESVIEYVLSRRGTRSKDRPHVHIHGLSQKPSPGKSPGDSPQSSKKSPRLLKKPPNINPPRSQTPYDMSAGQPPEGKVPVDDAYVVISGPNAEATQPSGDIVVVTTRLPNGRGTDVWKESAVEDVIPKLRQLKASAKKRG